MSSSSKRSLSLTSTSGRDAQSSVLQDNLQISAGKGQPAMGHSSELSGIKNVFCERERSGDVTEEQPMRLAALQAKSCDDLLDLSERTEQLDLKSTQVTNRRDRKAALKFLRKSMKRHGPPKAIVTDKLRSYGVAMKVIGNAQKQDTGRWLNNRAENSHLPFRRRERAVLRFRRLRSLQKFASVHASVYNHFYQERSLSSRSIFKLNRAAALAEWPQLCSA